MAVTLLGQGFNMESSCLLLTQLTNLKNYSLLSHPFFCFSSLMFVVQSGYLDPWAESSSTQIVLCCRGLESRVLQIFINLLF